MPRYRIRRSGLYSPAFVASGGGGSVFIAGVAAGDGGSGNSATTGAIDTTGANLIVITVAYDGGHGSLTNAVTDSKSNTYTALTQQTQSSGGIVNIWYCFAPTVGSSHTFTFTCTTSFGAIAAAAFSNASSSPFDAQNSAFSTSANPAGGNVTPSTNNQLIISGYSAGAGTTTDATSVNVGSIGAHIAVNNSTSYGAGIAWNKLSGGSGTPAGITWTLNGSDRWACITAGFKGT